MNRTHLLLLCILFLAGGCGGALKSGWTNFTAYYNTYYNAKEYYRDGLQAVGEEQVNIEPDRVVRVHPSPTGAGAESFKQALQKSAQVLQEHRNSVWADDALMLMGQSLYYLQEYAASLQRFEEVEDISSDTTLIAKSAVWRGRAMLDMQDYQAGLEYIQSVLENFPSVWSNEIKGELQLLAAEHSTMLEEWDMASDMLSEALSNIEDRVMLGKTFFLYGQVLERRDRPGEANYAYSQVASQFPGFEYTYWAERKRAETYRGQGSTETALSVYRQLLNDDKYLDRRHELRYDIARTLEEQEKVQEAEKQYQQLLHGNDRSGERGLQAQIYYRLGQLYSNYYDNYELAASYYDSSASRGWISEENEESADLLMQYVDLKQSIAHTDSLLQLGELPPEKLDSLLEEIRTQKRRELQEQGESGSNEQMRNEPVAPDEMEQANQSSIYGFLNHRSTEMVAKGKGEFQLIWGSRPLVDNWRREEAIRSTGAREEMIDRAGEDPNVSVSEELDIDFNPEAIPRTEEQRQRLQEEQTGHYYRLGNLLFLELSRPDSAKRYYRKVIDREESSLRPRAMYALTEIYGEEDTHDPDSLDYWTNRLVAEYYDTEFAELVQPDESDTDNAEEAQKDSLQEVFYDLSATSIPFKGAKMRMLAEDHASEEQAPYIHYEALEEYIQQAKALNTLTDTLMGFSYQIANNNPEFQSVYWDSVRIVLEEHEELFETSPYQSKISALKEELGPVQQRQKLPTCSESGISLEVDPSMVAFLDSVEFPEKTEEQSLFGSVAYFFVVDEEGEIESFELASMSALPDMEAALEKAFEEHLSFQPPELNGEISRIRCRVEFPLER